MSLSTASKAGQIRCQIRHIRHGICRSSLSVDVDWFDVVGLSLSSSRLRPRSRIIVKRIVELSVCRGRLQYVCIMYVCRLSIVVVRRSLQSCGMLTVVCRLSVIVDCRCQLSFTVVFCCLSRVSCRWKTALSVSYSARWYGRRKVGEIIDRGLFEEESIKQSLLP